jgi:signal transduction histidine kinase
MRTIHVQSDQAPERVITLKSPLVTLGRSPESDVIIRDPAVSYRHAEIFVRKGEPYLRDLSSRNGTYLNKKRIALQRLHDGDEIRVGYTALLYADDEEKKAFAPRDMRPAAEEGAAPPEKTRTPPEKPHTPPEKITHSISMKEIEDELHDIKTLGRISKRTASILMQMQDKLSTLSMMGHILSNVGDMDRLLNHLADIVEEAISPERICILLKDPVSGEFLPQVLRARVAPESPRKPAISKTIINLIVREKKAVLSSDAQEDPRFHGSTSISLSRLRSVICSPIIYGGDVIGVIHGDNVHSLQAFSTWDLRLLGIISNQAAAILKNAQLFREKLSVIGELEKAKGEILRWNEELEKKVDERTEELRLKNDEVLALSRQKDQLLGMAAHDLRNPLSAIMGHLELIDMTLSSIPGTEMVQEDLTVICDASRQMYSLLNDLLDVSKIEAGKIDLNLRLTNMDEIIRSCSQIYQRLAECKGISLATHIPRPLGTLWLDPLRIAQVLNNLVSNALKFSSQGDAITITAKKTADFVEISVADTGPGIPAEEVDRLFRAYHQTSTQSTGGETGTGLGLAIAKKLINLHGGDIRAESAAGVGSKFSFTLPIIERPAEGMTTG